MFFAIAKLYSLLRDLLLFIVDVNSRQQNNIPNDNKRKEVNTFPIPFDLGTNNENITITTKRSSKLSNEKRIIQLNELRSNGSLKESEKYYQNLIKQGSNDYRIFYDYAMILKDLSKLEQAEIFMQKAIEINPNLVDIYSHLGEILKDLGKFEKAEIILRKAIQVNPYNSNDYKNLGNVLIKNGKSNQAELATRKAIEINPNCEKAHLNLGAILRSNGKLSESEISTRKAIELNPYSAQSFSNLAIILKDLFRLDEAEISIRKAIELSPECAEYYSNLGSILNDLGKLKEAEFMTRKAIEIKPDFVEAFSNLGLIMKDLGRLDEAEILIRKAIELNPNFAPAHNNLGIILRNLAQLKEAEKSTRKAIQINPYDKNSVWNLYCLSNSIEEAEVRIKNCLDIDKNDVPAKLTLCALKLHQGDPSLFNQLMESEYSNHPYMRTFKWISTLPVLPKLFFNRWSFFDNIIGQCKTARPFYEYGVWRGVSFEYLIKSLKKGFGFDTFEGLPDDWHNEKKGTYSAEGNIPEINGGVFIKGRFEDTLPDFFSKPRPMASIINFDADLYSSTLCALTYSKSVIDEYSILIFDEFIINPKWEQDEFKALNEFCLINNLRYEVIAISYVTMQVAIKLLEK